MATIYDVANQAKVSISTVSHVLNGTRYVSQKTATRVLEAVERLNYRPNSLARALVRQETQSIALIVPENVNPFYAELARSIEDYGYEAGYSVLLCNSDHNVDKERAYLDTAVSKQVDGVIFIGRDFVEEHLKRLQDENIAVVGFDVEYEQLDAVLLNNYEGGWLATQHLISLGHRRIACIRGRGSREDWGGGQRVQGYRDALTSAGFSFDPDLLQQGDWTYQSGKDATDLLLGLDQPPTAIFACSDTMAIGVLASLHAHGIAVPETISVIGYDNIMLSAFVAPPLTTVATPIVEVGQQLCQMLLNRINGSLQSMPQRVVLSSNLIIRGSTA
jgi:LacI family transcriptional regulator